MSSSSSDPTARTTAVNRPLGVDEALVVEEGTRIGRYVVVGRLGAGGMGQVVAAYDPELDRRVALKLIGGRARSSDRGRERLVREAQALAKLQHPNVVGVFDVGTHGDHVFIAMEHIRGRTLQRWLDERPRTWQEIAAVMLEAGRGLGAAHSAGLVHRDFKPSNVMIDDAGRVRVLDFGLARRSVDSSSEGIEAAEDVATDASGGHVLSRELTEAGVVMGTPGYMAPEQFFKGTIDPRTDQFAFCVVLWRALFRTAPFPGQTFEEIGSAVARIGAPTPPRTHGVPRRIRLALVRGLSIAAADRFVDMQGLLAELTHALGRRRRGLAFAGISLAGVTVAVVGMRAASHDVPCRDVARQLDGIWDDARRADVEAALLRTSATWAGDVATRVRADLDDWTSSWLSARQDACEATHVRGEQSEHLMDLRVACLHRGREHLRAAVDLLGAADLQVVEHAVDVAQGLPDVDACSDAERLLSEIAPPDPDAAAEVEALRAELGRSDVLLVAGKYDEALVVVEAARPRIDALTYVPLQAEAEVRAGMLHVQLGHLDEGLALLDEALWKAIASGHDRVHAQALIGATHVLGNHRPADDLALRHIRNTEAVLTRLGHPADLAATAAMHAGTTHLRRRDFATAAELYQRAIDLSGDAPENQRVRLAAMANLAMTLGSSGDAEGGLEAAQAVLALARERLGDRHPLVGSMRHNVGSIHFTRHDHERAVAEFREALAISRGALGDDHPEVGRHLHNLSISQRALGQLDDALQSSNECVAIKRATMGAKDPSLAGSLNNQGDVLLDLGRPREALALFEEAAQILSDLPDRGYVLVGLGEAQLRLGQRAQAIASVEEALALVEQVNFVAADRGLILFDSARVIADAGGDVARARALAERARRLYAEASVDQRERIEEIDAWLHGHP